MEEYKIMSMQFVKVEGLFQHEKTNEGHVEKIKIHGLILRLTDSGTIELDFINTYHIHSNGCISYPDDMSVNHENVYDENGVHYLDENAKYSIG